MIASKVPITLQVTVEFTLTDKREISLNEVYGESDDGKHHLDLRTWLTPEQDEDLKARLMILVADEELDREEVEGRKWMDAQDQKQEMSTLDLIHDLGNKVYMIMNGGVR